MSYKIEEKDLRVDVYRQTHTMSNCVQMTHLPTGITVTCDEGRSDYYNKQRCLEQLTRIIDTRAGAGTLDLSIHKVREIKAEIEAEIAKFLGEKLRELVARTGLHAHAVDVQLTTSTTYGLTGSVVQYQAVDTIKLVMEEI